MATDDSAHGAKLPGKGFYEGDDAPKLFNVPVDSENK